MTLEAQYRYATHEVMHLVSDEGLTVEHACLRACWAVGNLAILARLTAEARLYFGQHEQAAAE